MARARSRLVALPSVICAAFSTMSSVFLAERLSTFFWNSSASSCQLSARSRVPPPMTSSAIWNCRYSAISLK